MQQSPQSQKNMIKFKPTNTTHSMLEFQFLQQKTIQQYKEDIASIYECDIFDIKFVFKGKVLNDQQKAGKLGLINSTVMMVINKTKKVQKPTLSSAEQVIPNNNLATGLGSSSPVGFGGYSIMNHPQYMSQISSVVDSQKMQEMMNDPFIESMMQQALQDPQTLKQLLEQNPMTKQLMDQNPMMKMIMANPEMMKMVFNKDTIKMAKQMQKNGNLKPQMILNSQNGANTFANLGSLGALGQFGMPNLQNSQLAPPAPALNNFSFGSNPFFPMMGPSFEINSGINYPNNQQNPLNFNLPFNPNTIQSNNSQQFSSPNTNNIITSLFQNLQIAQQKIVDETKYMNQIKQLNDMGFHNKQKCIKFLKQTNGDIDLTLQKLCLEQDQKEQKQDKKQ